MKKKKSHEINFKKKKMQTERERANDVVTRVASVEQLAGRMKRVPALPSFFRSGIGSGNFQWPFAT